MNEIQSYLQDLLTIDCDIQTNLQHLLLVNSREGLESKSNEIKKCLREFKDKLKEMKDFCDIFSSDQNVSFIGRFNRSLDTSYYRSTTAFSSPREILAKELQIQKEHLTTIETRFRNAYLAAQVKLEQLERENLFNSVDDSKLNATKKRKIDNKIILKQSNELTNKLGEISKQLKWTENQTSEILPVLDESSKIIKNTQQEFGMMKTVITDGKRLLVRLSRREFTDKLLIILCLCFFFSVVFYIVWKRIF